mgnify:CR=1 FL=1
MQAINGDAESAERLVKAVRQWQVENDIAVGGNGQPGIGQHFIFELAAAPAGVTQCNQVFFCLLYTSDAADDDRIV